MEMKKHENPPIFSTNWQIYRISQSLKQLTREETPKKRSRTRLWVALGVSMLSIATLFIVMPEMADVPKLMAYLGNKLTDILELITRALSST